MRRTLDHLLVVIGRVAALVVEEDDGAQKRSATKQYSLDSG